MEKDDKYNGINGGLSAANRVSLPLPVTKTHFECVDENKYGIIAENKIISPKYAQKLHTIYRH